MVTTCTCDDILGYGSPDGNPRFDVTTLFQQWDIDTSYMRIDTVDSVVDTSYYTRDEGHVYDDFLQRRSSYVGGNFALTSQINKSNLLQFGIDVQAHRLRYIDHLAPTQIDTTLSPFVDTLGGVIDTLWGIADTAQYYTTGFQDANGYGYRFRGYRMVTFRSDGAKNLPFRMARWRMSIRVRTEPRSRILLPSTFRTKLSGRGW